MIFSITLILFVFGLVAPCTAHTTHEDKMSVLQQVLTDARKLATRLRDHDSSAETLLSQAQGMFKQVESMKEYCEEMNELNEAANNRPRSALIHSIQQENRHIRQLQQENKELRLALEEHQNVMELIMSKYRQQVTKLVSVNSKHSQPTTSDQALLAAQIERMCEMVAVMRKAASMGDDESQHQQKLITALATENKGLREMLNIATRCGSVTQGGVDMSTQTELDFTALGDLLTSTTTTNNLSAEVTTTTSTENNVENNLEKNVENNLSTETKETEANETQS